MFIDHSPSAAIGFSRADTVEAAADVQFVLRTSSVAGYSSLNVPATRELPKVIKLDQQAEKMSWENCKLCLACFCSFGCRVRVQP